MKVYFFDEVENTQELAISKFSSEPILIIARKQLKGRGRKGNDWENADQALACFFHLLQVTNFLLYTKNGKFF